MISLGGYYSVDWKYRNECSMANKPNPGCLNGSPKHFPQYWYPLFPRAVATNSHKLGGLKQHKLTVLKAQSPKPRCWQGYAPSKHSREECFLASSGFRWLLLTLDIPWFVASLQSLPLSSCALPPYPCFLLFCVSTYITKQTSTCSTHNATVFSVSHLEVLNSAKALFPSKVRFTGTGIRT